MREEKGITIVMLVITIIVLGILAGVTIKVGGDILTKTNLQTLNTNMLLIQAKVKTLEENSNFNKNENLLKGTKIGEITDNQLINQLKAEGVIDLTVNYYLLSQEDLNAMGLEKIKIESGYLVDYENAEIIYLEGFKVKGMRYYKLSQLKELQI